MKRKNTHHQPLLHDLIILADDFAEHACVSAFLLTALSTVASTDDVQQPDVAAGAKLCAQMLQSQTSQLNRRLDNICQRYRAEHGKADVKN